MSTPAAAPDWIETSAYVTSCRYQAGALRAMSFGLPTPPFRIGFEYYAHGQLYTDAFDAARAIPQGERIPICYNPLAPEQNSRANPVTGAPGTRSPLIAFGLLGSVVLSLLWLLVMRSCGSP